MSFEKNLTNFVPLPYRRVSVQEVTIGLNPEEARKYLVGKRCFEATDFIVLREGHSNLIVGVEKAPLQAGSLFSEITNIRILAPANQTRFHVDPNLDTGDPSALLRVADEFKTARGQALIVQGMYDHVNFILDPNPIELEIVDLIPPKPARLVDLVAQALALGRFPPTRIRVLHFDSMTLAQRGSGGPYLFPCKVANLADMKAALFLDQHPPKQDWVLVGCSRSEQIYQEFYHSKPKRIETCPRQLMSEDTMSYRITRCCLLKPDHVEFNGRTAIVPWGAEVDVVCRALSNFYGREVRK
ncbi:MAG: hypothetical protein AB7F86_11110 [Bdellovibrionales bacterium]